MPRKTKKKGSAANTHVFDNVTVRFWYGGQFKHVRNGEMVYKGGSYINFDVDPDELCYWDLRDYGSKCGLGHVDALFYQMPGLNIEKGLRVIQGDAEVLEMGKLAVVNRSIVVYAVQFEREVGEGSNAEVVEVDVGNTSQKSTLLNADPKVTISKTTGKVLEKPPPKLNKRKKLTTRKGPQTQVVKPSLTEEDASTSPIKASTTSPKKASITLPEKASDLPQKKTKKQTQPPLKITSETQPFTQNQSLHLSQFPSLEFVSTGELPDVNTDFNDEFEWEDDRPESPLKWNELVADDESSDDSDPLYDHEYQKFCEGGEFEDDDEDDFQFEVDESIEKEKEGDFSLSDIDLEGEGEDLEQTDFFEDESDDIDDEIIEARDRVKRVNTKLLEIVKGLQEKTASSSTPATQFAHHTATAQPTQLGRGGRMILGGQGARSVSQSSTRGRSSAGRGSTTTSRGRGRGRGRAQPSGIGIMFADDGSPIVTAPSTRPNTRSISQMQQ
uniref:PB1-like domain-containing protein n=1 Tax=Chenopodium quinoa TaxID=63459 RepID=A0A803MRD4_CHEQI